MSICYFAKFIEQLGLSRVRVMPVGFSPIVKTQSQQRAMAVSIRPRGRQTPYHRLPLARTFRNNTTPKKK